MQSHDATPAGLGLEEGDYSTADTLVDNVVPLFGPRLGSLASVIAAAAGPTQPHELLGESDIRATFRAVMSEAPPATARRRHKLAPFAIACGSVAGLVAGTAGLSAAAVLPPAANHLVAQVLRQVGIDVAPAGSLATGTSASRGSGSQGQTQAQATKHARQQHGASPNSSSAPLVISGVATQKLTATPKLTSPSAQTSTSGALCEVAVVQSHAVLLRLPSSSIAGQATPIAGAVLLSPAGSCSNRRITLQDLAAAKSIGAGGTGGSSGPGTGGGSGGPTTGGSSGSGTGSGGTGTGGGSSGGGTGTGKGTNGGGSGKGTNGGGSGGGKGHGHGKGHPGTGGGSTTPPTTTPPTTTPPTTAPPPSTSTTSTTPPTDLTTTPPADPATPPATPPSVSATAPATTPADPTTTPADPTTTPATTSTTTPATTSTTTP